MSKTILTFKKIKLLSADIGEVNPMPDLMNVSYIHAEYETTPNITDEDKKYFGKGMIDTILPYLSQDGYNRNVKEIEIEAAVLENDMLCATFLPTLGGRLWSLYNKKSGVDLLYVNKAIQPGNLAIRNAWFAGGVEWNVGIKGHTPLTCGPMFAAESANSKGEPILSMYEYERKREVVYGINAYLPDDGETLYIRTTIENKTDKKPYMYWWSNIAVPEKNVRVLTDADEMFSCVYGDNHYIMDKIPAPIFENADISYPERAPYAGDVFFILDKNDNKKWIASLDKSGTGLLQYSTPELLGRKVFFWGKGQGGRNWNKFLTYSDDAYIEIQAGLLRTQMEHMPMPENTTWSWTECYTTAYNAKVDGDWKAVAADMKAYVDSLPNPAEADIPLDSKKTIRQMGSGWGAMCRDAISDFYEFPSASIDKMQSDWINLDERGYLPDNDGVFPPVSYMVNEKTLKKLESSLTNEKANHWYTYLHLGLARYVNGNISGAEDAWKKSCSMKETAWNNRNLAMLYKNVLGDPGQALYHAKKALKSAKTECRGLIADCAKVFVECGAPQYWLKTFEKLSPALKENGRMRLYVAMAYMAMGNNDLAKTIINENFKMDDIKEGELSISAIWQDLYGDLNSLPKNLNFRMHDK